MEAAVFINSNAARVAMGRVPWFKGRRIGIHPVYKRNALQGYRVVVNGKAITEDEVKA